MTYLDDEVVEVMVSRMLVCVGRGDWLPRLQALVERHQPNLVCLLEGSPSEVEALALEALHVSCVFVSPRASGNKPRANTAKVLWLANGPCRVGHLVLAGLPRLVKGDAADMVSAGLLSPETPRVLVWAVSEQERKKADSQQLTVMGSDAGKPGSFKVARGPWGDAVGLNLQPHGAVVLSFTFYEGAFFSLHVEEEP